VQGQSLRDHAEDFDRADVVVLGISFDTSAENRDFADAQGFPFHLLSDVSHEAGRRFGVDRRADDQYADFCRRYSFLVDPDGVIRRTYDVADVAGHADAVLADLAALQATADP
jgi:peroxiredoxin Q/BCP